MTLSRRSDIELTLVVREVNLPQLLDRVECAAFRLVEQPDGRYSLAVELDGPPVNVPGPAGAALCDRRSSSWCCATRRAGSSICAS